MRIAQERSTTHQFTVADGHRHVRKQTIHDRLVPTAEISVTLLPVYTQYPDHIALDPERGSEDILISSLISTHFVCAAV